VRLAKTAYDLLDRVTSVQIPNEDVAGGGCETTSTAYDFGTGRRAPQYQRRKICILEKVEHVAGAADCRSIRSVLDSPFFYCERHKK